MGRRDRREGGCPVGSENYLTDRDDLGRGGVAEPAIWDRKRVQRDNLGQAFGRPAAEVGIWVKGSGGD